MKRIVCILLAYMASVMVPLQAAACGLCGAGGSKPFYRTYNEGYLTATLVYPEYKHLYYREVMVDEELVCDHAALISERFSFPIYQQREDSRARYSSYSLDQSYTAANPIPSEDEWRQWDMAGSLEDMDTLYVTAQGAWLQAGVRNIYQAGLELVNDDVREVHYDVSLKRINDMPDDATVAQYEEINALIAENGMILAAPEILSVGAGVRTTSYNFAHSYIPTDELYDPINIQIYDTNYVYDDTFEPISAAAVRFDKGSGAIEKLRVEYSYGTYSFDVAETGVYALVEDDSGLFAITTPSWDTYPVPNPDPIVNHDENTHIPVGSKPFPFEVILLISVGGIGILGFIAALIKRRTKT